MNQIVNYPSENNLLSLPAHLEPRFFKAAPILDPELEAICDVNKQLKGSQEEGKQGKEEPDGRIEVPLRGKPNLNDSRSQAKFRPQITRTAQRTRQDPGQEVRNSIVTPF